MSIVKQFPTNLRSERLRKCMTQEVLAAKANLSVSYISMLERGERSPPLDTLELLAKALKVSPASLIARA